MQRILQFSIPKVQYRWYEFRFYKSTLAGAYKNIVMESSVIITYNSIFYSTRDFIFKDEISYFDTIFQKVDTRWRELIKM